MYEIMLVEHAKKTVSLTVIPCTDLAIVETFQTILADEKVCVSVKLIKSFSIEFFHTPDPEVTYGYAPPPRITMTERG